MWQLPLILFARAQFLESNTLKIFQFQFRLAPLSDVDQ